MIHCAACFFSLNVFEKRANDSWIYFHALVELYRFSSTTTKFLLLTDENGPLREIWSLTSLEIYGRFPQGCFPSKNADSVIGEHFSPVWRGDALLTEVFI